VFVLAEKLVLAFDIGTTALKASLVEAETLGIRASAAREVRVLYPRERWAEQDPEELWSTVAASSREVLERAGIPGASVVGVVFSAHMAGVLPVDERGEPLRNIIIWLDERAAGLPEDLWRGLVKVQGYNLFKLLKFLRITGGAPSKTGKDPLPKMIWLRENEPEVYRATHKFLDVKGYLINRATGAFVTSPDEANLTWLADTRGQRAEWSRELLKDYGIPVELLPEIRPSTDVAGRLRPEAAADLGLEPETPVLVGAGDITVAAVGSGAVGEGEFHAYIGTSDWIAGHVSERKTDVAHYIGCLLSAIPGMYLLIAEQEVATGALEWLLSVMGMEGRYEEVEEMVEEVPPGSRGIIFLPWFYGERAPIDDPFVRGGVLGLSLDHGRAEVLRAVMESVAFNMRWAYQYVEKLVGRKEHLNLIGGGALFDIWCQILADVLGREVRRMAHPQEAGVRGAAAIACVGLGIFSSFEEAASRFEVEKAFRPEPERARDYNRLFSLFVETYKRLKKVFRELARSA